VWRAACLQCSASLHQGAIAPETGTGTGTESGRTGKGPAAGAAEDRDD
jgi:hypothetical protein